MDKCPGIVQLAFQHEGEKRLKKNGERRKGQHLTEADRYTIQRLLEMGWRKQLIADSIGYCLATVYNEIRRGTYMHTKNDLSEEKRYSADMSWRKYREGLEKPRFLPKLLADPEQLNYLCNLILNENYSPAAAIMRSRLESKKFERPVTSVNTIYKGIEKGYFEGLKLSMLPDGGHHRTKKKPKAVCRVHKKRPAGETIDSRPKEVASRDSFGHWEMDTVIGKQKNRKCILVLTERKTRYEIMEVLNAHTADEVRKALNRIEKRFGASFYQIFQTITVDNGTEFSDCSSMQKALYRVGRRTNIYYCHPHTPSERGTNENVNKMVRRWWYKGMNFDDGLTRTGIKRSEEWINDYPRAILGGKTAKMHFNRELYRIGCSHLSDESVIPA